MTHPTSSTAAISAQSPCPCGRADDGQVRPFAACCGPYLEGHATPATAEALMRSRYTAYAVNQIDYIEATSGGDARRSFSRRDAQSWANAARFTKLEVLATERGAEADDEGLVDFAATFVEANQTRVLRERSRFGREDGLWRYLGAAPNKPVVAEAKPGRNDPCSCGSGKKYKKCCGA